MPTFRAILHIRFKATVCIGVRYRFFRWWSRPAYADGFYQGYGITSETEESAKRSLQQRVKERYPEWLDNFDIDFEEFEECNLDHARYRLQTDWKNLASGDPEEDGIWMEGGAILYSEDDNASH